MAHEMIFLAPEPVVHMHMITSNYILIPNSACVKEECVPIIVVEKMSPIIPKEIP